MPSSLGVEVWLCQMGMRGDAFFVRLVRERVALSVYGLRQEFLKITQGIYAR